MFATLYFITQVIVPFAGLVGNFALAKHKNRKPGILKSLLSFFVPPVGIAWGLLQKKHPPQGRTPEENEMFLHRFNVEEKKKEVDKREQRNDKLELFPERSVAYRMFHPGQWFSQARIERNNRILEAQRADIRSEYEMLGRAQRKLEMSGKDRFVAVRMTEDVPGMLRFGLPYDISPEQANEIKMMIVEKYKDVPDIMNRFYQSEHRAADMGGYRLGQNNLVFDTKEKRLSELGAARGEEIDKMISETAVKLDEKLRRLNLVDERGFSLTQRCITLNPIGKDAVGLNINGVCVAYAVAGEDGKIRTMGHDVKANDRKGMRLASQLGKELQGCATMEQWVGKASNIALSSANIGLASEYASQKMTNKRRLREKREVRNRILTSVPSRELKAFRGIKM